MLRSGFLALLIAVFAALGSACLPARAAGPGSLVAPLDSGVPARPTRRSSTPAPPRRPLPPCRVDDVPAPFRDYASWRVTMLDWRYTLGSPGGAGGERLV